MLLPPAIIFLVFAMVVIAVGGFAYFSVQQQSLGGLRTEASALRDAMGALSGADAAAAMCSTATRTR